MCLFYYKDVKKGIYSAIYRELITPFCIFWENHHFVSNRETTDNSLRYRMCRESCISNYQSSYMVEGVSICVYFIIKMLSRVNIQPYIVS